MKHQVVADTVAEALKAAPPVAVVGAVHAGLTLQDAVYIATLVYVSLQAGWLLWKWYRAVKAKNWVPSED